LHGSSSLKRILTAFSGLLFGASSALSASYDELRSADVQRCQIIDPGEYQSGLLFNPDGYRSYYVRSECFQRTAVQFRDDTLCAQVRQRHSLFSSSWGYSPARCREQIAEGVAADQQALEEVKKRYQQGAVRLRDFRVERNGNGRDFDIIPSFTGDYAHGHILRFEIIPANIGKETVLLHSSGYYVEGKSNLRIFLMQEEIRKRFPDFALNRPYPVRATLVLDVGHGGQAGHWSDALLSAYFRYP